MKTLKLFTVLSLALIFVGISSLKTNGTNPIPVSQVIRYQVTIHAPTTDRPTCNLYLVEMVDQNGNTIAPPQVLNPSKNVYTFYELGTVKGVRIARIIIDKDVMHYSCPVEFMCAPDKQTGIFLAGETYPFNLYPTRDRLSD